jgi:hypothetical protein
MPLRLGHGMMRNHRGLARVAAGFLPNLIAHPKLARRLGGLRNGTEEPNLMASRPAQFPPPASIASPANLKPRGFSANG